MGDIADMHLEDGLDEYDGWRELEEGPPDRWCYHLEDRVCRYCGEGNLRWVIHNGKWRLSNKTGHTHTCLKPWQTTCDWTYEEIASMRLSPIQCCECGTVHRHPFWCTGEVWGGQLCGHTICVDCLQVRTRKLRRSRKA